MIYVAAVEALWGEKKERGGWNSVYWSELVEKLVWVLPVIAFLYKKISFPVTHLMPYYGETGHSHLP